MSAALRISVATSGGSVGRLVRAARARVAERPAGAALGRVRGRVGFGVSVWVEGGAVEAAVVRAASLFWRCVGPLVPAVVTGPGDLPAIGRCAAGRLLALGSRFVGVVTLACDVACAAAGHVAPLLGFGREWLFFLEGVAAVRVGLSRSGACACASCWWAPGAAVGSIVAAGRPTRACSGPAGPGPGAGASAAALSALVAVSARWAASSGPPGGRLGSGLGAGLAPAAGPRWACARSRGGARRSARRGSAPTAGGASLVTTRAGSTRSTRS